MTVEKPIANVTTSQAGYSATDGRAKWVVVGYPPGSTTGLVLDQCGTRSRAVTRAALFRRHLEGYARIEVEEVKGA